jgi:hypothetical protein
MSASRGKSDIAICWRDVYFCLPRQIASVSIIGRGMLNEVEIVALMSEWTKNVKDDALTLYYLPNTGYLLPVI